MMAFCRRKPCANPSFKIQTENQLKSHQREILEVSYYSEDMKGINIKQKYKHIIQLTVMLISVHTLLGIHIKVSALDWNTFILK
jgi:hypothetical protein